MSIFEYDEEKHLKNEREYAFNQGMEQGEQRGIHILIRTCLKEGISKERIFQVLGESYSLSQEEAEKYYAETENSITQNR